MRGVAAAWGALIALALLMMAPSAAAAEQETLYLGTDGFPFATLVGNPLGGELPNFDRGRDIEPGLLLEISTLGLAETDATRYQHWQVEAGGRRLTGYPTVVIWSAPAGFAADKEGWLSVYLLDCNPSGADCKELGAAQTGVARGQGSAWVESWLAFDPIDHSFAVGRYLAIRVVVPPVSESDMMIAYGYARQRSRLTLYSEPPDLPQTAVVVGQEPVPSSHDLREKLHRGSGSDAVQVDEADDIGPSWAWMGALTASTILLVGLGAALVSRLTRPGRHEIRSMVGLTEPGRSERVPVS
jgi:hypothetical protein